MKLVCIAGEFDPLMSSDIEFIKKAKFLGDRLYVIVYNDKQLQLKNNRICKSVAKERLAIIGSMKWVDSAMISIDDDLSFRKTLIHLKPHIFANNHYETTEYNDLDIISVTIL